MSEKDNPQRYSALDTRPVPKTVQSDDSVSYVAGVKVVDALTERKRRFNGWENDPDAQLVVRAIQSGDGAKFEKADFSDADFSGAVLSGVNFAGADLRNANLAGVDLRNANLAGADLRGVNLEEADLEGANLEGAILDGAYLKNTRLAGVKLAKKALNELELMQRLQREAEEGTVDLRHVNLRYLDLRRLDLRGVDLTGLDLSGVNLVGVNLSGCKIDPAYLDGSYAFRQTANRTVKIAKGSTAGLDPLSASQIRAGEDEKELLRQKRLADLETEAQVVAGLALAAQEQRQKQEHDDAVARLSRDAAHQDERRAAYAKAFGNAAINDAGTEKNVSVDSRNDSENMLSKGVEMLRQRRLNAPTTEELKARLQDVVLEDRPTLKSGAKVLITHRPRKKIELPPSKYDFPVLYPVDEPEKKKVKEEKSVVRQMTDAVKEQITGVIRKLMPSRGRVRVKRQRQRQRS